MLHHLFPLVKTNRRNTRNILREVLATLLRITIIIHHHDVRVHLRHILHELRPLLLHRHAVRAVLAMEPHHTHLTLRLETLAVSHQFIASTRRASHLETQWHRQTTQRRLYISTRGTREAETILTWEEPSAHKRNDNYDNQHNHQNHAHRGHRKNPLLRETHLWHLRHLHLLHHLCSILLLPPAKKTFYFFDKNKSKSNTQPPFSPKQKFGILLFFIFQVFKYSPAARESLEWGGFSGVEGLVFVGFVLIHAHLRLRRILTVAQQTGFTRPR